MTGKLFLDGGGDADKSQLIYNAFLEGVKKVAYIPLAWPSEDYSGCNDWIRNSLGKGTNLEITMSTELKGTSLDEFDGVFIGGGNTFKLLKKIKEAGFDKKLISFYEKGGNIIGGSAGALIFGYDIGTSLICADKDKNLVGLKDTKGMDQVKGCDIQAHFEKDQIKEHQEYIARTGRNVVAIPERSALVIENGKYLVLGNYPITYITKDNFRVFDVGSQLSF